MISNLLNPHDHLFRFKDKHYLHHYLNILVYLINNNHDFLTFVNANVLCHPVPFTTTTANDVHSSSTANAHTTTNSILHGAGPSISSTPPLFSVPIPTNRNHRHAIPLFPTISTTISTTSSFRGSSHALTSISHSNQCASAAKLPFSRWKRPRVNMRHDADIDKALETARAEMIQDRRKRPRLTVLGNELGLSTEVAEWEMWLAGLSNRKYQCTHPERAGG